MSLHLGWFRDCGIIPHTADVDFGIFIEDYEPIIKKAFLGNRKLWLRSSLGLQEEGFELQLSNGFFSYDNFFLYKTNETHMWSGYHGTIRLYKYLVLAFILMYLLNGELIDIKKLVFNI